MGITDKNDKISDCEKCGRKKPVFIGAATALITPFRDGKIDFDSFAAMIDFQISGGVSAVVVLGTTGESATIDEREGQMLAEFAVRYVNGRLPVIVGTGGNNTEKAARMAEFSSDIGADALLCVTPYYNKATTEGLVRHYEKIADSSSVPLILYNVPSRTGMSIQDEVYDRLYDNEKIVAVKEASGSVIGMCAFASLYGDRYDLYSGSDEIAVPTLSIGGKGVISVVSNIVPDKVSEMCSLYMSGQTGAAGKLQLELMPLISALFCEVNPVPVKYAMSLLGFCECEYRLPLCEPSERAKEDIKREMKKLGLI